MYDSSPSAMLVGRVRFGRPERWLIFICRLLSALGILHPVAWLCSSTNITAAVGSGVLLALFASLPTDSHIADLNGLVF